MNMTSKEAKRLIVVAVVVSGALAAIESLTVEGELPRARIAVGVWLAAVLLALLAEAMPSLAGAFAALFLTASILTLGPSVVGSIRNIVTQE